MGDSVYSVEDSLCIEWVKHSLPEANTPLLNPNASNTRPNTDGWARKGSGFSVMNVMLVMKGLCSAKKCVNDNLVSIFKVFTYCEKRCGNGLSGLMRVNVCFAIS